MDLGKRIRVHENVPEPQGVPDFPKPIKIPVPIPAPVKK